MDLNRVILLVMLFSFSGCSVRLIEPKYPCHTEKVTTFNPSKYKDQECVKIDFYVCDSTMLEALNPYVLIDTIREDSLYLWERYFAEKGRTITTIKKTRIYKHYWCNTKYKYGKD